MATFTQLTIFLASFLIVALASQRIGQFFARFHLPLISGFLFAGILAGPYVLGLISREVTESLRFVDEISLAVIAFAAGSELYLKELHSRMRSIAWVTIGNILVIPTVVIIAMMFLADAIPFMREMPTGIRLGIALITGAILVARSPSSAIAIVNELRASGPFTKTVLGVTMLTDVAVIVMFAVSSSVADALLAHVSLSFDFLFLLLLEFGLELGIGYLLGLLLADVLAHHLPSWLKIAAVLLCGYAVFVLASMVRDMSTRFLEVEIFLEPLLICMIASFWVTNFTPVRSEFLKLLHDIGPTIYIAFFTLTGASLALDVLARTWPIALVLFIVRIAGIFAGSFLGGVVAGEPRRENLVSWMAYVTQAGVGLGLAKEVAVEFPEWGSAFATIVISAIVLSQLIGPPLFKWAINAAGEAHTRGAGLTDDAERRALIFGLEAQSIALARLLQAQGWHVMIASRHATERDDLSVVDVHIQPIPDLTLDTLRSLRAETADAIVTLLSNDENYHVCELAYEHFGTETLVARLTEWENPARFRTLGATVVEPSTAIARLLDHFVRTPSAASLLLGLDESQSVVDVRLSNPDLDGLALRELRLPLDILILGIRRNGSLLLSHGYTRLELGDWITVVGSPESVQQVLHRFSV